MSYIKRKGVVFTLDAIVALVAAALMVTSSYFYLTGVKPSEWQAIDLSLFATDSLAALEINNDLETVILSGSVSSLETFLNNMLPDRMCGRIRIHNTERSMLYQGTKTACTIGTSETVAVSFRSFIARGNVYYAKMEAWYEY